MDCVSANLYEAMKLRRMSQAELAEKAGVSKTTITKIVKNRTSPTVDTLQRICGALDIQMRDLFTDSTAREIVLDGDRQKTIQFIIEATPKQMDFIIEIIDMVKKI
ncbi:MAG: helix-turn-helix transcriptional regulator [Clostridiales bacterium]|nr:helix-turn-helix transcriptional regulator [Clostridiales bacterium]